MYDRKKVTTELKLEEIFSFEFEIHFTKKMFTILHLIKISYQIKIDECDDDDDDDQQNVANF